MEKENMQSTWLNFCRENDVDQLTTFDVVSFPLLGAWWDYVSKNYAEPLPTASPWGE